MNRLQSILALLTLTLLTSCDTREEGVAAAPQAESINFATSITSTSSKGMVVGSGDELIGGGYTNIKLTGFGVFAFQTLHEEWLDVESLSTTTPDFMYNQEIWYDDDSWKYSPIKYWAGETNTLEDAFKYTFFAYAPYQSSQTTTNGCIFSSNDKAGRPTIDFTIAESAFNMVDLVTDSRVDQTKWGADVDFEMTHQLARVSFSAKCAMEEPTSYIVVNSMKFLVDYSPALYTSARFNYSLDSKYGDWTGLTPATEDYSFDSILKPSVKVSSEETQLFLDNHYLFLLPPNAEEGVSEESSCRVEMLLNICSADGTLLKENQTASFKLQKGALKQGSATNYLITYTDIDPIESTAIKFTISECETPLP
ncbi:MAG: fimbrillin family protein [Rikenellaceae bacterium]